MGVLLLFLILLLLLLLGLGYVVYTPMPSGFAEPYKLRVIYSSVKLVKVLTEVGEALGLGPRCVLLRDVINSIQSRHAETIDNSLIVINTLFDEIPVRVYVPKDNSTLLPGLVFFHGGGGVFGSVRGVHSLTQRLAKSLKAVVVSVEYRLAPEHIFPAAFDDCVTATSFFMKHAADFGVDAKRIGVIGDSTGGNLAATTALKLRDDGVLPPLKTQVLLYPMVQAANFLTPSYRQNAEDIILGTEEMALYRPSYFQGNTTNGSAMVQNLHTSPQLKAKLASTYMNISNLPKEFVPADYVPGPLDVGDEKLYKEFEPILLNPYACPLLAEDLSNLPMTYIFTGQNDVLRDEGFWYAQRLTESGVSVTHRHAELGYHGVFCHHKVLQEASAYTEEVIDWIRSNL